MSEQITIPVVTQPEVKPSEVTPVAEVIPAPDKVEVVPEVKGDPNFNFESFLSPTVRAAQEVKPAEETPKVEEDAPKVEEVVKPAEVLPATLTQEFSPEVSKLLKQMSNPAREFALARIKEAEEFKTKLAAAEQRAAELSKQGPPQSYYENPNAYQLLPEYNQAVQSTGVASSIAAHWRQQLINIARGEEWTDLEDKYDANGKYLGPAYGAKQKPTAEAQVEVQEYLNHATMQAQQFQQKVAAIKHNFGEGVKNVLGKVKEKEREIFNDPAWDKPESVEYKAAQHCANIIKQTGVTELNPLFGTASKLAATVLLQRQYIQSLQNNAGKAQSTAATVAKVGPTGVSGGVPAPAKNEVTMDAFDRVLNKRW